MVAHQGGSPVEKILDNIIILGDNSYIANLYSGQIIDVPNDEF